MSPHMKLSQAQSLALNAVLCFSAGAAIALLAKPAKSESQPYNAFCAYSKHDHTIPLVQGPCRFYQTGTTQGARGATVYVTLPDGTDLFYDGRYQGTDFNRINSNDGIWLNREGDSTLVVSWEKPGHESSAF